MEGEEIKEKCLTCGTELVFSLVAQPSIHYARLDCPKCKKWKKFVKKPENELIRTETTKCKVDMTECKICDRKKDELGKGETLVVAHFRPLDEGGLDVPENVACLCVACHRLIHWARLYLGTHFKEKNNKKTDDIMVVKDTNYEAFERVLNGG